MHMKISLELCNRRLQIKNKFNQLKRHTEAANKQKKKKTRNKNREKNQKKNLNLFAFNLIKRQNLNFCVI